MPEQPNQRRLAAIMVADVVGYSRMMEADEARTLKRWMSCQKQIMEPLVRANEGRIVKSLGDGVLVEFASAVNAVKCAIKVQRLLDCKDSERSTSDEITLRIGIALGDIVTDGNDIFGDGVNIASRLQALASPGGICMSENVRDAIYGKVHVDAVPLGNVPLKNISRPIHAFELRDPTSTETVVYSGTPLALALALPLPDKPSIVILPFDDMSPDHDHAYLADGTVEEITAALARIRGLFVIARNTAFAYRGQTKDVRQIGRELGVQYVLEGSIRTSSNQIRITAQLIEAESAHHIWSESFKGDLTSTFDLQDEVTARVAGAILPSIQVAEIERARRKRPSDLRVYDLVMRALPHVWALLREDNQIAGELLDKALQTDSSYPLALSLRAWCYAQLFVYNWTEELASARNKALEVAEHSAEVSNDDPFTLAVLGAVHAVVRNLGTASVLLEKARSIDQNSAFAWNRSGWVSIYADKAELGLEQFQQALRLSPLDPMAFTCRLGIGCAYFSQHRSDLAAEWYLKGLAERPGATWIHRSLVPALFEAGRIPEAKERLQELLRAYPGLTMRRMQDALPFKEHIIERYEVAFRSLGMPE